MDKQEIPFNLNQSIKVKLTPLGIGIMYRRHDELDKIVRARGGRGISSFSLKTDDEGYTTFQMWEFIQIFGNHVGISKAEAFDINIKILLPLKGDCSEDIHKCQQCGYARAYCNECV